MHLKRRQLTSQAIDFDTSTMSSTTESSEWNVPPESRPTNNLDELTRISLSPPPQQTDRRAFADNDNSSVPLRIVDNFTYATSPAIRPTGNPDLLSNDDKSTQQPPLAPTTIYPSIDALQLDKSTPEWEAARESVLSQMVTSQDINHTSTPKIPRGGAKTGGRRGRGGRRPKIKIEPASGESVPTLATTVPSRVRLVNRGGRPRGSKAGATSGRTINRGGRPRGSRAGLLSATTRRGIKRKRKSARNGETDDESNDTDASEEINLPILSSSGRRITQANTFTPGLINLDSPHTIKKQRLSNGATAIAAGFPDPTTTSAPKKSRPKIKRTPGATAVCKNCGRGHSPSSNQIVFCDGCDTPWHQYCHDRPITPSVIQIEEKEWYCADCSVLREERVHLSGRVAAAQVIGSSGAIMGLTEKRRYFQGLGKEVLVSLLLHACEMYEDLRVFEPNALFVANAAGPFSSSSSTIVSKLENAAANSTNAAVVMVDEDEIYEEPLPYPRMGNGLVLPPEEDDLDV
ncbi:MAG: hypothetical protein Q9164_005367, partial [Protoblastenia rupestris]